MNQHAYKIIFNKRLGRMDVVSEIVSNQGKGSQTTGYSNGITTALIKPLVFALMLTLGTAQILPVQAGTIVADPNAPKTEQPTILNTASGATQVNIQTPTAGGVSMNQYKQFDTQSNGTILNNSRTNANTQTAGWIQGNPWLATGTARVIVNQVNSSNPSLLNGNIEVAGNRAEVIIANPAGIQVNGATFINAARTTLSTGKPIIDNGNLTGYQVNQGQISINGQGLNTQGSDYTDILARSVQINAGIWANQLKVTTGVNTINADNTQASAQTANTASGTAPQFAIDTSALGGMYAGKITLIGTEQGVGVNNAGQIAASAGHVTVDVNGQLSNSGTINANLDSNGAAATQIKSQSFYNSGTISSQGNTQIQTGQATNSGTLAAGRELKLNASDINNSKGTINGQRIELNANNLNNTNGKIQQTGTQALALNSGSLSNANNGLIGYEPLSSGTGTGTGTGSSGNTGSGTGSSTPSTANGGGSSTVVQPAPVAFADGAINISGAVNNDGGQITANGGIDLTAKDGLENHATLDLRNLTVKGASLDNSSGQLALSGTLNSTTDSLNNQSGKISAQSIQLTQQTTNNAQGSIQAIDTLTLNSSGLLNNQAGTIGANQAVNITAGSVQNSQKGSISSSQSTLNLTSTGVVDNASGTIKANQALNLSAQGITNDSGLIGSGQNLTLSSPTGALSNQSGQIVAGNELKLNSSELNNQSGRISAAQTQITTGAINNISGSIITQKDAQITSQALDNTSGLIYAGTTLGINTQGQTLTNQNTNSDTQGLVALQNLSLQSGNLNNNSGRIQSNQAVTLNSADISSIQGNIQGQSLSVTANSLNNNQGKAGAKDQAHFTLNQNLSNQGGQIWSETGAVTVQAASLDNSSNGVLSANRADLTVSNLNNQQATVSANTVNIQTADLNNQSGLIESAQQNTINATRLNNADGKITSTGQLDLTTQTASLAGQLSANGNLNLTAQADMTSSAQISAGALATIAAQNLTNQGTISGQGVQLTANNLTNQSGGEISSKQTTQITTAGALSNQGLIDGKTTLIHSANTENSGRIYGDQLAMSGDLNNHDTGVIATRSGTLNLAGNHLTNQAGGLIHSEGDLNIGGSLDANYQTSGSAQVVDNLGSTIESQGNMTIASAQVNNRNIGFSYSTHETIENIPQEHYIRFINSSDPNLAVQLFKPEDLGKCRMCKDDNYDAGGLDFYSYGSVNIPVRRYEYVPDSERYPFAMGYARHTYQTQAVVIYTPGKDTDDIVIPLHYDDTDPVWNLFGVTVGDYAALVPKLKEYNADYMNRTRLANSRDYYSIYINQRQTSESKIDNPGQAAVISSGGAMTFKGSDIFNDNSKIIAGGKLDTDGRKIRNNEAPGSKTIELKGTWSGDTIEYDPYEINYADHGQSDYSQLVLTETITLSNDLVQENLGGYITGSAPTANNTTTANSSFTGGSTSTDNANSQTTQGLSGWVNIRNTSSDSITIPNSSLFTLNPNAAGSYVQTDPRFTSYGQWLSSDYMLSALKLDPADMHKRLGDGYYEQKLIRDQVAQLTGRRFLTGYNSDDDQYKALMNAGVTFAGQYNLRPGIALTPEQLARLTSDIVWLVEETVTLPNGSKVQALVPKVYVAVKPGDVTGEGALISADSMDLKLSGNLDNSGTLLGRHLIKMDANNITNSGLIQSNLIDAKAQLDFNNIGGTVDAHTAMNIEAGRDVNVVSTTSTAQSHAGLSGSTLTQVDRVAGLYVGNGSDSTTSDQAMISLSVKAGRDVNLTAASLQNDSKNQTVINADGNIKLNTVQTQSGVDLVASDVNNAKYLATHQVGTQINTTGNVQLKAKDSITATAANINSDKGKVILVADKDVNLVATQNQLNYESNTYAEHSGFLSSSMSQTHQKSQTNTATGSNVTGQQVLIQAVHDANVVGSNVVSDNLTQINAGNDINILAAQNTQTAEGFSVSKQSGLLGTGGFGFMIGSKQQSTDTDNTNITQTGSQVGSLSGKVNIVAGNHYQQTGSSVTSGQSVNGQFVAGDAVNIVAKSVDITAGQNTYANDTVHQTKQSGLTVAVNVPVVNAVMAVADTAKTVGQSKNDRVNAMAAANTAYTAVKAADALKGLQNVQSAKDLNVSVSITVGSSQSKQETHAKGTEAVSSNVAGKEVNIIATGAGTDSNIHVQGSNISGTDATRLIADNNVILESAQNTSEEHSANKSSGWNAGVAISYGQNGLAFGVTAGGNVGKGKGEGTSVTQVNSHVGSQSGQTLVQAGGDTTLAGAQLLGQRVELDTNNLIIESRQDTNQYDSKQMDASAQVTVGYGFSASGSYSQNKTNADYASVNEQSGILAGDGGYNVNVKKHTDLKGGIITSTQAAEDAGKNSFTTGTLSTSDIQNHADYSASGFGIGGGFSVGGSGTQDKDSKLQNFGSNGPVSNVNKSIGYGSDSGHDRSITTSGINTSNITLTDAAGQNATGTRVEQIKAQVKTDTTTDTVQANSGAIANNFDKDAVQKEVGLQVSVTQQFDTNQQAARAETRAKEQEIRNKAEAIRNANGGLDTEESIRLTHEADNWNTVGIVLASVSNGLYGPNSNGVAGAVVKTLAPVVANQIGDYFSKPESQTNQAGHVLAHTVLGAAVAAAAGNDALSAALSAGTGEAITPVVANYLYGTSDPSKLTPEQMSSVSAIIGLGGTVIGATSASSADIVNAASAGQNAVDNNALSDLRGDAQKARLELAQACSSGGSYSFSANCQIVYNKWMAFSAGKSKASMDPADWATYADKVDKLFMPAKRICNDDASCLNRVSQLQLNAIVTTYGHEWDPSVISVGSLAHDAQIAAAIAVKDKSAIVEMAVSDAQSGISAINGVRPTSSASNSLGIKQPKASNAPAGSKIPTPTTDPGLFHKRSDGSYEARNGEIWVKSYTNHSNSDGGEWKVGYGRSYPTSGTKVTVSSTGTVIKHDK